MVTYSSLTIERWYSQLARYNFKFLSELYDLEIIARGNGVNVRKILNTRYGLGRWRKLKGKAIIENSNGEVWLAEIHCFEAHGIGQRDHKSVRDLERIRLVTCNVLKMIHTFSRQGKQCRKNHCLI